MYPTITYTNPKSNPSSSLNEEIMIFNKRKKHIEIKHTIIMWSSYIFTEQNSPCNNYRARETFTTMHTFFSQSVPNKPRGQLNLSNRQKERKQKKIKVNFFMQ